MHIVPSTTRERSLHRTPSQRSKSHARPRSRSSHQPGTYEDPRRQAHRHHSRSPSRAQQIYRRSASPSTSYSRREDNLWASGGRYHRERDDDSGYTRRFVPAPIDRDGRRQISRSPQHRNFIDSERRRRHHRRERSRSPPDHRDVNVSPRRTYHRSRSPRRSHRREALASNNPEYFHTTEDNQSFSTEARKRVNDRRYAPIRGDASHRASSRRREDDIRAKSITPPVLPDALLKPATRGVIQTAPVQPSERDAHLMAMRFALAKEGRRVTAARYLWAFYLPRQYIRLTQRIRSDGAAIDW